MYFDSIGEFIEMGGHGLYVWSAYAVAAAVFAWNVAAPLLQRRGFLRQQARRLRRERSERQQVSA